MRENPDKRAGIAVFYAVLAAALYALSLPVSKLLLGGVPKAMLAAWLYLGAGAGLAAVKLAGAALKMPRREPALTKRDAPYLAGMVALDIAAPILLMAGLARTEAANAALLNNFEIVATSLIAFFVFKETVSRRLWFAIGLVTLASVLLSVEDASSFRFSGGSALVLLACVCWGFENNCTRKLSGKDALDVVIVKGLGSGLGALVVALCLGERAGRPAYIAFALLTGFVSYGLSIFFYIRAQRVLGAAKTSAYYALSPFIGVAASFAVFGLVPSATFFAALAVMAAGAYLAATDAVR